MKIGNKILAQRKKAGFSQEELAEKMGISRQAVSRWETGEAIPDTEKIIQLSKLFQVPTDYLLLDEVEELSAAPQQMNTPVCQNEATAVPKEGSLSTRRSWPAPLKWAAGFGLAGFAFGLMAIIMAGVFSDTMNEWYTDYGKFGTALFFTWRAALLYIGLGLMVAGLVIVAVYAALKWKPVVLVLLIFAVILAAFSVICSGIVLGVPALLLILALLSFLVAMWVKAMARRRREETATKAE
ncbi:MAG: helix-turn-helix transcriptional regulator [Clostridiales bacterium]|nr:helix-turn-helix transcriptional regulator [Clostridiales bacterium]